MTVPEYCVLQVQPMLLPALSIDAYSFHALILLLSIHIGHVHGNEEPGTLVLPDNTTDFSAQIDEIIPSNDSTILPPYTSNDEDIFWPESEPFIPPLSNPLNTSSPPSSLGGVKLSCNSTLYGKNLNPRSCLEAWTKMVPDKHLVTFGQRGTGDYDANLPFRILSSDGQCAFDVSTRADVKSDTVFPADLKANARVLLQVCVAGTKAEGGSSGGVISNIGTNGGLAIRVTKYKPTVHCDPPGSGPPWRDCRDIIDTMPADGTQQVFGRRGDTLTNITKRLPIPWQTNSRRCQIMTDFLRADVRTEKYDWYKLWAAANAVDYMCVQYKQGGLAIALGECRNEVCVLQHGGLMC